MPCSLIGFSLHIRLRIHTPFLVALKYACVSCVHGLHAQNLWLLCGIIIFLIGKFDRETQPSRKVHWERATSTFVVLCLHAAVLLATLPCKFSYVIFLWFFSHKLYYHHQLKHKNADEWHQFWFSWKILEKNGKMGKRTENVYFMERWHNKTGMIFFCVCFSPCDCQYVAYGFLRDVNIFLWDTWECEMSKDLADSCYFSWVMLIFLLEDDVPNNSHVPLFWLLASLCSPPKTWYFIGEARLINIAGNETTFHARMDRGQDNLAFLQMKRKLKNVNLPRIPCVLLLHFMFWRPLTKQVKLLRKIIVSIFTPEHAFVCGGGVA